MADTSNNVGITKVIPDHQVILETTSVLLRACADKSEWVQKGVKTVDYPTVASTTGAATTRDGAFVDENLDSQSDSFDLDVKLGGSFSVNIHEDDQNALARTKMIKSKGILTNMGRQADLDLYGKANIAASYTVTGTASLINDITEMILKLDDANVPKDDRFLYMTNKSFSVLSREVKDFIRFKTDKDGAIGEIYGVKVLRGNIAGADNDLMFHREGIQFAYGSAAPYLLKADVPKTTLREYSLSRMFGGKAAQAGNLVCKRTPVV